METEIKDVIVIILLILAFFTSISCHRFLVKHRFSHYIKSFTLLAIILFTCFMIY
ncbi:MAG TPA: hypothetical protein PLN57_03630 [bacterium]|jgi:hypothetical protein|nr:hypothetical protein [bacterium]